MTSPQTPALAELRQRIDDIDNELLRLLAERMSLARLVIEAKRSPSLPVRIPERIDEVTTGRARIGADLGLDPGFVTELWTRIVEEMCREEERLLEEGR